MARRLDRHAHRAASGQQLPLSGAQARFLSAAMLESAHNDGTLALPASPL
jgi:hypothetical protein